ncbi:hypothetical protein CBR_g34 [Chara braunii]|uniref:Kinesin-like protein n=1 Tax=Chara braunii TaxID=69332 RepID=A0A388JLD4_CHABU|nr:hypothetical protein CBR_g34 [Chara braunii]|eukprot:GBG58634.1 hypothetical protein CBR_g34 [Chara braunii]
MGRGLSPLRLLLGRSPSKRQQQEHLHQQQQQQQHQGGQGAQAQAGGGGDGCEPSGTGKGNATGDRKPLAPAENNAREGDTPAADGAAPVVDRIDIGRAAGSKHHHGKTKPSFARHNVGAGGDAKGGGGVNLCVGAVDAGRGLAGGSARERSSSSTPPRGATGPGWHPAMRGNSNTNPNPNANGGVPLATGGIATGQGQAARLPQPQQSARGGQSEFEGANPSPGGLPGSSGSRMLSNLAAAAVQDGNRSSPRTPVKLRPPPGFDQSSTAIADPPQPTGGVSEHQQHQQNHAGISNRRAGANQGTPGVAEVGDNARSKTPRRSDMAGAPSSAAAAAAAAAPLGAAYRGGIGAGEANGMTPSNQQQPGSAVGTGGYGGATLPNTVKLTKQRGQQARDLALGDGGGPPAGQNGQAGLSLKTAKQIYRTPKYQNGDGGPNAAPVMGFTGGGARTAQRAAMAAGSHIPMFPHLPVEEFDLEETWNSWTEDQSVQVIVRLRPINARESSMHGDRRCLRQDSPRSLIFFTHPEPQRFTFDHVAGEHVTQERLFRVAGFPMVENCLEGYNSCMFAYGQEEESRRHEQLRFNCKCSYLEIYNESITDLLDPTLTNLQIREDTKRGMYVESLSEKPVEGVDDVLKIIVEGSSNRKVGQTSMNRESSRSHSVFTCVIESRGCNDGMINVRFSRLNLVDLAGSERQKSSGAEGERLKEAANINKSLSQLGHVIMTLVDVAMGKQRHVPYRGSRLTFLLQDSLGGNAKTVMVANLSPSLSCFSESLSTLKFAQRAKYIQNKLHPRLPYHPEFHKNYANCSSPNPAPLHYRIQEG